MGEDEKEELSEPIWGTAGRAPGAWGTFALRVLKADRTLRTLLPEREVTYIGRMPENHVVLDDAKVSRSHARIFRQGETFIIEDQASENGIRVNGRKVARHRLRLGDRIAIGGHVLEIVRATEKAVPAAREEALSQIEAEEWRMDRTVSVNSEKLEEMRSARRRAEARTERGAEPAPAGVPPTFEFTFAAGKTRVSKRISFERGRRREAGAPNEVEIRIGVGSWILEKKIPLD